MSLSEPLSTSLWHLKPIVLHPTAPLARGRRCQGHSFARHSDGANHDGSRTLCEHLPSVRQHSVRLGSFQRSAEPNRSFCGARLAQFGCVHSFVQNSRGQAEPASAYLAQVPRRALSCQWCRRGHPPSKLRSSRGQRRTEFQFVPDRVARLVT